MNSTLVLSFLYAGVRSIARRIIFSVSNKEHLMSDIQVYRPRTSIVPVIMVTAIITVISVFIASNINAIIETFFPGTLVITKTISKNIDNVKNDISDARDVAAMLLMTAKTKRELESAISSAEQVALANSELHTTLRASENAKVTLIDNSIAVINRLNRGTVAINNELMKEKAKSVEIQKKLDSALVPETTVFEVVSNHVVTPVKATYADVKTEINKYEVGMNHTPMWLQSMVGYNGKEN